MTDEKDFMSKAGGARAGFFAEMGQFMRENKKWWLTPIIIAVLVLGTVVILGGTAAAPFIYTLF